jgi:N-acetylglucosaminyl-diphospho-decaprenol L-rhamnosyltransferase
VSVEIAAAVVHYGDVAPTVACVRSLLATGASPIVVNNGPPEVAQALRAGLPGVEVLEAGRNLGYAGGNNLAFRRALERGAEFVLVLNNDAVVTRPDFVDALVAKLRADPRFGIAGPLVVGPDGATQPTEERFPSFLRALLLTFGARRGPSHGGLKERAVDAVNGVALVASRSAIEATGGFDERYFMYGEEVDFCYRARRAGFLTLFVPIPSVVHHHAAGEIRGAAAWRIREGFVRFCRDHRGSGSAFASAAWFLAGAALRDVRSLRFREVPALAGAFRRLAPEPARTSWRGFAPYAADVWLIPVLIVLWMIMLAFGSAYSLPLRRVGASGKFAVPALLVLVELPRFFASPRSYLRKLRAGPVHVAVAAFVAVAALSYFWTVDHRVTIHHSAALALLAVAVLLAPWRVAREAEGRRRIAAALVAGMLIVAVANAAALVVFGGNAIVHPPGGTARFRGFLESPDSASAYVLAMPLALSSILTAGLRATWGIALGTLLLAIEVVASGTRLGIALLAVLVILFASAYWFGRVVFAIVLTGTLAAGLLAMAVILSPSFRESSLPGFFRPSSVSTLGGRTEAWSAADALIGRRPLGGFGFATEEEMFTLYRAEGTQMYGYCLTLPLPPTRAGPVNCSLLVPRTRQLFDFQGGFAHNSYLGLGIQLGAAGLAATIVLLLVAIGAISRAVRRGDGIQAAVVSGVVVGLLWALFSTYLWNPGNLVAGVFWLLFVVGLAHAARLQEEARLAMRT